MIVMSSLISMEKTEKSLKYENSCAFCVPEGMPTNGAFGNVKKKSKAVPLHAMEALGVRGDIAPTHSRPRH
jgi:hypothetical protein